MNISCSCGAGCSLWWLLVEVICEGVGLVVGLHKMECVTVSVCQCVFLGVYLKFMVNFVTDLCNECADESMVVWC